MNTDQAKETRAIITGMGMVCFALFAGVSLYTHSPFDVMDYHAAQSQEIQNKAGLVGALLAHHALSMYGIGAWVVTIILLVFGGVISATRSMSGLILRLMGAALMTALVCAWAGVLDDRKFGDGYPAGAGGLLGGTFLAPPLIGYFGKFGVLLVLTATTVLCLLMLAPGPTEIMLALVGRGVVKGSQWVGDWIIGKQGAGEPALAVASASQRMSKELELPAESARVAVLPEQITRKKPILPKPVEDEEKINEVALEAAKRPTPLKLKDKAEKLDKAEKKEKADPAELLGEREVPEIKAVEKKQSRAELEAKSEAEESERRRQEAMRQAEAAESERLERDRKAKEDAAKQNKLLEKLEKEHAEKDREKAKQAEKFQKAMAEAAGANADANGEQADGAEAEGEVAAPKPQLPINYDLPKYDLLIANDITPDVSSDVLKDRGATLIQTLWDFKIGAKLAGIQSGPAVTMYEMELDPGIKVQRVVSLQDNLAMAMKAEHGVRIIAPIPGKASVGIEIPNAEDHTVRMRPILESPLFRTKSWTLPLILGRDAVGNPLVADLATMPHLLIAGTTGSGKSVCVNSIILSIMILRRPHEVKLILVDPKQVEMTDFKGIPHLLTPVVTDMKLAAGVLTWAVMKMEQRYERMSRVGVRNIATYNKLTKDERLARLPEGENPEDYMDPMPYLVIIVDEFADLMMTAGKEIEQAIARLAQKARAAGLHVILATQRPSADVVTGLIKTNLPCRICFQVKSKIDSRIVLDQGGADKLAGKGDMLFIGAGNSNLVRAKGVYIADDEIRGVVNCCKVQAEPIYSDEIEKVALAAAGDEDAEMAPENNRQAIELDEKFDEAVDVFLACGRASTSLLQRRMGLGYTRAAKLCDQMEARGIVGPDRGAKGRELLITQEMWDSFKRTRANNNGSAWGPRGSKDNPAAEVAAEISSVAATLAAGEEGTGVGESINPALLAELSPVDGTKDDDGNEQM